MSLKFGIYLVEQRIISPEQFCGLVKIQQDAMISPATLAIRKNMMTIKQVAQVLDLAETNPEKSFIKLAMEQDLIDRSDADQLVHFQQLHCPSIRKLIVECGLLTERQTSVLYLHFERHGSAPPIRTPQSVQQQEQQATEQTPAQAAPESGPRQPKFQQRPVVVRQMSRPSS